MICNIGIHEGLRDMGKVICPFCEKELQECKVLYELCCDNQNMINDTGKIVCQHCGKVDIYNTVDEYIDFYKNIV